jgi:sugar/nucleoside kinase (ribokinase family)
MTSTALSAAAATFLDEHSAAPLDHRGVIGLDGFVDQIIRVVDKKTDDGVSFIPSITALSQRIAGAAGKSTGLELDVQTIKLGGNGPIMANAMAQFGLPLTYVGAIGQGAGIHPVFQPMAERCELVSLCEAANTDALEFADGKVMLERMGELGALDYEMVCSGCGGADAVTALLDASDFLALNHWSSLPYMTDIWRQLQQSVCPQLSPRPRTAFFDLADLTKRSAADIREALEALAGFTPWYRVVLGLNEGESERVGEVLGNVLTNETGPKAVAGRSRVLCERLGYGGVVIHALAYAAAGWAGGSAHVAGPYIENPLISTGAGDHFNSGLCLGLLLGADNPIALQLGVACSGYYVRTGESPAMGRLAGFLRELASQGV